MYYGRYEEYGSNRRPWLLLGVAVLAVFLVYRFNQSSNSFLSPWSTAPQSASAPVSTSLSGSFGALKADSILGPPTISPQRIDAVLASYGSPAEGTGQVMYDLGVKYGIDPAYCLAFFIHESTAGTRGVATVTKSIGNIRTTAGYADYQGYRMYDSWETGIEDWYLLIRDLYVDGWNLTTLEQILPVYAPPADNNDTPAYIATVRQLIASWRGQP